MADFFQTGMGQKFYNVQIPQLNKNLERIADALEKIGIENPETKKEDSRNRKDPDIGEIRRRVKYLLVESVEDIYTAIHNEFKVDNGDAWPMENLAVDDALDEVVEKMLIILSNQIEADMEG